jgi:hypothetical protein
VVTASGKPIPLIEYDARQTKAGVSVKVMGGRKLIKGAFIAQRMNGVSGVFIEDKAAVKIVVRRAKQYKRGSKGGWHAFPCRKLYGPSVGGIYANDRIQAAMRVIIARDFEALAATYTKHHLGGRMPAPGRRRSSSPTPVLRWPTRAPCGC